MRVPREYADSGYVPWLLKCQLAVQSKEADGSRLRDATSVQNHGAVDDVFGSYDGPLGCQVRRDGAVRRSFRPFQVGADGTAPGQFERNIQVFQLFTDQSDDLIRHARGAGRRQKLRQNFDEIVLFYENVIPQGATPRFPPG